MLSWVKNAQKCKKVNVLPTNRPTDRVTYRVACTRLKNRSPRRSAGGGYDLPKTYRFRAHDASARLKRFTLLTYLALTMSALWRISGKWAKLSLDFGKSSKGRRSKPNGSGLGRKRWFTGVRQRMKISFTGSSRGLRMKR